MWTLNAYDVFAFRNPGGDRFTALMDDVVRTHATLKGVPIPDVMTNVRTNKPDGGVDTQVRCAVPGDDTEFMDVATSWQYKAKQSGDITEGELREEIRKPYSAELIGQGYGYRLCVCDDFPAQKVSAWETILTDESRSINSNAARARVLNASQIATWVSRYKGLVVKHFKPHLEGFRNIESWGQSATAVTRTYVQIAEWNPVVQALAHHLDPARPPEEPVLCIQAQAGTGKTRLVYEVMKDRPDLHGILLYTNSPEQAMAIARSVLNDGTSRLLLIADECPVESRVAMNDLLTGVRERCRVICIDNSFERPATGSAEYRLDKIPTDALQEILKVNFPNVPEERRRAYVDLADGYVRFASDLCKNDPLIAAQGGIHAAFGNIRGYLSSRLLQDFDFVCALSLLTKLGCAGSVQTQIGTFCRALARDEAAMRHSLDRVKEQIGFVVRTPDYYYVTPELVAQICFADAWARWVAPNIEHFLTQLDSELLDSFQKRVARSGAPEVRQALGVFFRQWAAQLSPPDLFDKEAMLRLEVLIDTDPDAYLPVLADLVGTAPDSDLPGVTDEWEGNKIRRRLVWLTERLASFPEYFQAAESILLKLAINESERAIDNNATNVWRGLFRIVLSGTATPLQERLKLLRERIYSTDTRICSIALSALSETFNHHAYRMVGPSTVAGRIVPPQWQPHTYDELYQQEKEAFDLLSEVVRSDDIALRTRAVEIVIEHVRQLLAQGYLASLQPLIVSMSLSSAQLPRLLEGIDHFLQYDAAKTTTDDYADQVRGWADSLIPKDFHGRVVSIIGKQPWHHLVEADKHLWEDEVEKLAKEIVLSPDILTAELAWLCSGEAKSAGTLGQQLGQIDREALCFKAILAAAANSGYTALAQGYVQNLLPQDAKYVVDLNVWLDEHMSRAPLVARDIAFAAAQYVDIAGRLTRAIVNGELPLDSLRGLGYGRGATALGVDEFRNVLSLISKSDDVNAARIGLELLGFRLWLERQEKLDSILQDPASILMVWNLVGQLVEDKGSDSYRLFEVMKKLEALDRQRVALLAGRALISDAYDHRGQAQELLADMVATDPELVIDVVGQAALDPNRGWYFQIGTYKRLVAAIPTDVVVGWLKKFGVSGARRLARHLPAPSLDQHGNPVLHPLTAYVLEEFEADDSTFSEFCAGVHSFQLYSGDIARQHEQDAVIARAFLSHRLRRVRQWAQSEERSALKQAELMRKDEQERWLE